MVKPNSTQNQTCLVWEMLRRDGSRKEKDKKKEQRKKGRPENEGNAGKVETAN